MPAGAPPRALLPKLAFWLGVSGCLPEWRERDRKEGESSENTRRRGGTHREIERAPSDQYSLFFSSINVRLKNLEKK